MADYNRGNRSGGGNRNFSKPRFSNDRQEMYSATCANCGRQCEVPFRPTGNKPVLCRECFQNNRGSDSRRPERGSFNRPDFNNNDNRNRSSDYSAQFEMLNAKMDKILDLLSQIENEPEPLEPISTENILEEITEEVPDDAIAEVKKSKKKKSSPKLKN